MALCEVCIHLLSARDVKRSSNSQIFHKAVVSLPGLTRVNQTTEVSERPNDPKWNQAFTFNVPTARLTPDRTVQVKIFESSDTYCGQASVPLWGLKDTEVHRYPIVDEGGVQQGIVKVGVRVKGLAESQGHGSGSGSPNKGSPHKEDSPTHAQPGARVDKAQCSHADKTAPPQQQKPLQAPSRPGLSIVTLESEMKKVSTGPKVAHSHGTSHSSSKAHGHIHGEARPSHAGPSKAQAHVAPKGPSVYIQPATRPGVPPASYPPASGHPPAPYGYPGAPPPGVPPPGYYPLPPPGAYSAPYIPPAHLGPPPGPPAPYHYGAHGSQGPTLAYGGGGQQVMMLQSRPRGRMMGGGGGMMGGGGGMMSGAGGMIAGAAVGAGLGILGGMALEEALDDDYDDDDF